ncbi:MAG: leucine-rich repeat domain-containing protein [Bacteroidota bacterium]
MRRLLFLSCWLIIPLLTFGQCESLIQRAQQDIDNRLYQPAITKLLLLQEECPANRQEIGDLIQLTFNLIEGERNRADSALEVAQRVLDALYFYEGKFALSVKEVENGVSYEKKYGFINKQGKVVIPYEFDGATPFSDRDGFSRVKKEGQSYLLDTTGNIYILATSLEALDTTTEALDLHTSRPKSLPENIGDYPNLKFLLAYGDREQKGKLTTLPTSIGKLKNLEVLDLAYNRITHLPESFSQLHALRDLNLTINQLSYLPERFGNLTQLEILLLARNTGLKEFPASFQKLKNLKVLDIETNEMGALPDFFGELTSLQWLDASFCELTTLPSSFVQLTELRELDLSFNQLDTLPPRFGQLTNLVSLDLYNNSLKEFPDFESPMERLESVNASKNEMTTIPTSISNCKELVELNVAHNNLSSLPGSFADLKHLEELELDANRFLDLPLCVTNLSSLKELSLWNNGMRELPEEVGKLTQLVRLEANSNQFTHLPISIERLSNLEALFVANNNLRELPESIKNLPNLKYIRIDGNPLMEIPGWLPEITDLEALRLDSMGLTTLPTGITNLTDLKTLSLKGNNLATLPEEIGNMSSLDYLDLTGNQLTKLPASIEKLTKLKGLLLTDNNISDLPNGLSRLKNLEYLQIERNQIKRLPNWLCELPDLHITDYRGELFFAGNPIEELPPCLYQQKPMIEQIRFMDKISNAASSSSYSPEVIEMVENTIVDSLERKRKNRTSEETFWLYAISFFQGTDRLEELVLAEDTNVVNMAITFLERQEPDSYDGLYERSKQLHQLGQHLLAFDSTNSRKVTAAAQTIQFAFTKLFFGQFTDAIKLSEQAIMLDSTQDQLYYHTVAFAYLFTGENEKAMDLFNKTKDMEFVDPEQGKIFLRSNYLEIIPLFRKADIVPEAYKEDLLEVENMLKQP